MGLRLNFFKNNFDKGLKDLLFDNFTRFSTWYLELDKSSIEKFDEPFGNEILKDYFKKERSLPVDFEKLDKNFIDELTAQFIGTYSDSTDKNNDIFEFFGPMFNKWRYDESIEMILKTGDNDFIELWTYITKGRSLKDRLHFDSLTNEYKIGFLDRQEYLQLKSKIEFHFGDYKTIKNKYWTNKEKEEFKNAVNDSSFILTGHNPKTEGLEYVLSALNELTDKNKELITVIE